MSVLTQLVVIVMIVLVGKYTCSLDVRYLMSVSLPCRYACSYAITEGVGRDRGESGCHRAT